MPTVLRSRTTRPSAFATCSSATLRTSRCRRRRERSSTNGSPAGSRVTSSSSETRSSATTSSRRTATVPSSTPRMPHSRSSRTERAEHLAAAGNAAFERGDYHAASSLLERAAEMHPPEDEQRLALAPELAGAFYETGNERYVEILDAARAAADPITRARAAVSRAEYALAGAGELPREERDRLREEGRVGVRSREAPHRSGRVLDGRLVGVIVRMQGGGLDARV